MSDIRKSFTKKLFKPVCGGWVKFYPKSGKVREFCGFKGMTVPNFCLFWIWESERFQWRQRRSEQAVRVDIRERSPDLRVILCLAISDRRPLGEDPRLPLKQGCPLLFRPSVWERCPCVRGASRTGARAQSLGGGSDSVSSSPQNPFYSHSLENRNSQNGMTFMGRIWQYLSNLKN